MTSSPDLNPKTQPAIEKVQPKVNEQVIENMSRGLRLSQRIGEPRVSVMGLKINIDPEVFSPSFYSETEFFTEQVITNLRPNDDYLDMGCGAGATAICAAVIKNANVTAVDVNPLAVSNTQKNIDRYLLEGKIPGEIVVGQSDVYDGIDPEKKFDVIFWNTPFGYLDPDTEINTFEKSVFDPGYKATQKFIMEAKSHLKPDGKVLIGFSSTLGNLELLMAIAEDAGMKLELLAQTKEENNPNDVNLEFFRGTFRQ